MLSPGKKQTVSNNDVSVLSEHVCEQGLALIIFQNTRKTLTIILAKKNSHSKFIHAVQKSEDWWYLYIVVYKFQHFDL